MTDHHILLWAIFLPLIASPLIAWGGQKLGGKLAWPCLLIPILSFCGICLVNSNLGWGHSQVFKTLWIPSLGINLNFLFDGLSTFFGLVVCGMGVLIVFYARFYLGEKYSYQNRFYAYLMLFMGAMLGTVFSNNLMLLFIFWELTGIASFFLIGFSHHKAESRTGARMALLVTSFTGLVMLIGIIVLGINAGSYELDQLFLKGANLTNEPWLNLAFILIFIGALGKSAQFPFHFWLPNAMAAPTPVSAYLHSATMVKLGIFLCARLFPLFVICEYWGQVLVPIGFITMALGSFLALRSNDLKAILAFSTISQLGFLVGFYGMGTPAGVSHDYFHILNHVFYKGALFMMAGIIDHATGTRDIRKLGGLYKKMPLTAIAFVIAALAMAGIPGTTGFISKELMLGLIFQNMNTSLGWLLPITMMISAICMVAFSIRLFKNTFWGHSELQGVHKPSLAFQIPAFIGPLAILVFGFFPDILGSSLQNLAVTSLQNPHPDHLALWHGFNLPLLFSTAAIVLGMGTYLWGEKKNWQFTFIPTFLQFDTLYSHSYDRLLSLAKNVTKALRGHRPFDYLLIVLLSSVLIISLSLFQLGFPIPWHIFKPEDKINLLESLTFTIIVAGALGTVIFRNWIRKLISLSITGFLITFYFVLYRAPDLALTQILIEAVSLILVLLFMTRLPTDYDVKNQNLTLGPFRKTLTIGLSVTVGVMMTSLILFFRSEPPAKHIGQYFLENTVALAQGQNAVNTVLVDFRGYDTMGEVSVLVIAMLGVLGLLMRRKRSLAEDVQGAHGPAGTGDA